MESELGARPGVQAWTRVQAWAAWESGQMESMQGARSQGLNSGSHR